MWLLLALAQAIVLTAVCVAPYGAAAASPQGKQFSLLVCGTLLYTCVIFTVSIQISIAIQVCHALHSLFMCCIPEHCRDGRFSTWLMGG